MANNHTSLVPEFWAREGLAILTETIGAIGAVNRQFSDEIAKEGATVNAHRAARQTIERKDGNDDYTAVDVTVEDVPVRLDQLFVKTFIIRDYERSLSIVDLIRTHLKPAMQSIARGVDRAILGRVHEFLNEGSPNLRAGKLGGIDGSTASDYLLEANQVLNVQLCPEGVKNCVVGSVAQTGFQKNLNFITADKVGDDGQTLRTGLVGQVYNILIRHSQNANYCYASMADVQTAVANNGTAGIVGYNGTITVVDPGTNMTQGEYVVFAANAQPTWATATNGTTTLVLNEPLKYAIVAAEPYTHYLKCANEATERAAGYKKPMTFTHTSGKYLQVGQLLSFGDTPSTRHTYTIIEATIVSATTTKVLLDRPLEATVASAAAAFPGPGGGMNLVMHQDALSLVSRPMALPEEGSGASSFVAEDQGLGIRVTMQYMADKGGTWVNVDLLCGVAVLDPNLACVLLS
jgi:hypothetical protein